jgi:hypothetical protein
MQSAPDLVHRRVPPVPGAVLDDASWRELLRGARFGTDMAGDLACVRQGVVRRWPRIDELMSRQL